MRLFEPIELDQHFRQLESTACRIVTHDFSCGGYCLRGVPAYDASKSTRSEAFSAWQAEVACSRRIEAEAESLDVLGLQPRWDEQVSLRFVMLHLIHEYARHNGHADFL